MNELYKMILVDDEDEVRGRISSKISHDSGFTVVGTAGNGYDALELIEAHSPHVVITDIKMPFIDGIELATIIKRDFPTIRVAFITGFDEFEYAREAVELHVTSYLTKPVTQNDISHFLDKLKLELDNEFKEKYSMEKLRRQYEESIPLILDNYFTSMLVSSRKTTEEEITNLKKYGVSLDDSSYLLSFIRMERGEALSDIIEYEKAKLSVRSAISSIMERHTLGAYSFLFNDGLVFLIKESGDAFLKNIDTVFYEMVRMAERFLSVTIDVGVSQLHCGFGELGTAWQEARKALDYSKFLNTGRIVYIDQLEKAKPQVLTLGESEIKRLEYDIRFAGDTEIRNTIDSLKLNALRDNKTVTNFRHYIINLTNILVNFSDSIGADLNEITGDDILVLMQQHRSLEQMFDWVLSVIMKLREFNLKTKMTGSQKILDSAVNYIEMNYRNPGISMEMVCDNLGISVSYMSLLFKKHKQTTFVKYLTRARMEKAKELLKLTGDKIVDIAGQCGYNEVYYFSHSFKKYTGLSPKKYREEISS